MKYIQAKLLDALEMFQYSYRFRDSLFVLFLHPDVPLESILTDLKLLQSSHITAMLVCRDHNGLDVKLKKLTERGLRFWHIPLSTAQSARGEKARKITSACTNNIIPVLALPVIESQSPGELCQEALALAEMYDADKFFYISPERGLSVKGVLQSHLSPSELDNILSEAQALNIDRTLLGLLRQTSTESDLEIVLLEGASGSLFQEIFTHRGRGTLLTNEYPNIIRRGRLRDVFDISRLLRPYIEDGTILPASEDEVAEQINSYFVYTVNNAIVAAAQLVDYGTAAALSKFCTLPRYQGKGRARKLAKKMIAAAKAQDKERVFALSISPRMWSFFARLGMREVPRETLPDEWKKDYDFSRPSRAFALELRTN